MEQNNNLPYNQVVEKLNKMKRTYVEDLLREEIFVTDCRLPIEYEIVSQFLNLIKCRTKEDCDLISHEDSPIGFNVYKDGIEVCFVNGDGETETLLDIVIKLPH